MGMNFTGLLFKDGIQSLDDLSKATGLEYEKVEDVLFEESPFDYIEENEVAVLIRNGAAVLYFQYDWLGELEYSFEVLSEGTSEMCFYAIGETSGVYRVEFYSRGYLFSEDDYEDAEVYHTSGPNRLNLKSADVYFSGIIPLMNRWLGEVDDETPFTLYRVVGGVEKTVNVDSKEFQAVESSGHFHSEVEFVEAAEGVLNGKPVSLSDLKAFLHASTAFYAQHSVPDLGFLRGMSLDPEGNPLPLQCQRMVDILLSVTDKRDLRVESTPVKENEFFKVVRYTSQHHALQYKILRWLESYGPGAREAAHRKMMASFSHLANQQWPTVQSDLILAVNSAAEAFTLGFNLNRSDRMRRSSIAELKKFIHYGVVARKQPIDSHAIGANVLPAVYELMRRGADFSEVIDGNFNPSLKENKIEGIKVSPKTAISGFVIVIFLLKLIVTLARLAG